MVNTRAVVAAASENFFAAIVLLSLMQVSVKGRLLWTWSLVPLAAPVVGLETRTQSKGCIKQDIFGPFMLFPLI